MLIKYLILDSMPLETLFNSSKYGFEFKLGSKMSPKYLTWLSDLRHNRNTKTQLVSYSFLQENGTVTTKLVFSMFSDNLLA